MGSRTSQLSRAEPNGRVRRYRIASPPQAAAADRNKGRLGGATAPTRVQGAGKTRRRRELHPTYPPQVSMGGGIVPTEEKYIEEPDIWSVAVSRGAA